MKKFLALALVFCTISLAGHFYLAKRAYQLEAGEAPASRICSINENINCDSALMSPYASVFNMSLSNFGLAFNLVLALLLISFLIFGANSYWKNMSFYLAGFIALASTVMAVLSLVYNLLCPICWTLYACSFITLAGLFLAFKSDLSLSFVKQAVKQKNSYILGGSLLIISLFFHMNFVNAFDIKSGNEMMEAVFSEWLEGSAVDIPEQYLLEKGPKNSQVKVVEFADFLCHACKSSYPAMKKFLNNFPDVKFQFFVYPLDGTCNPSVKFKGSGLSCELSKLVICANKQGKGWPAHDFIFEHQSQFQTSYGDEEKVKDLFKKMSSQYGINEQKLKTCMKSPAVLKKVRQSALIGEKVSVQGTPSFFVNGKPARHYSEKLLILRRIYKHLKKTSR